MLQAAQVAGDPPLNGTVTLESVSPTPTFTPLPTETPTSTLSPTPTLTPTPSPTATRSRVPPTATPTPHVARVPILMYHYVSVPPSGADKYRLDLSVTPDAFETQMDYLATNGYHPIQLADLANHLLNDTPLPDKPIVLTFDDGYADNYTNVFPTLRKFKFTATFFVITDFVNENRWGYLSWTQLAEMVKGGMEVGSHTVDHPDLYRKSRTFQNNQIAGSKKVIEANLPITVVSFSYPAGHYDSNTIAALRAAGYRAAVMEKGVGQNSSYKMYELGRIRVRGGYPIDEFARSLR